MGFWLVVYGWLVGQGLGRKRQRVIREENLDKRNVAKPLGMRRKQAELHISYGHFLVP